MVLADKNKLAFCRSVFDRMVGPVVGRHKIGG